MYLFQIPTTPRGHAGETFQKFFHHVKEELEREFDGVTAYLQAPAEGYCDEASSQPMTTSSYLRRRSSWRAGANVARNGVVATTGKRYDYQGESAETYAAVRNAFVKGRFFNEHIRDRFPYRRVTVQVRSEVVRQTCSSLLFRSLMHRPAWISADPLRRRKIEKNDEHRCRQEL